MMQVFKVIHGEDANRKEKIIVATNEEKAIQKFRQLVSKAMSWDKPFIFMEKLHDNAELAK
jgi:hypothetical protein